MSPGLVAKSVLLRGALLVGPCWGFLGPSPCPCQRGPLCRLRRVPDPTIQYFNIESYYNYRQPIEAGIPQTYELTLKFGKELIPELLSLADCCLCSSIIFFLNTGDCWKSSLCICNIKTWLKCYWYFGFHIWWTYFICSLESRIQEYFILPIKCSFIWVTQWQKNGWNPKKFWKESNRTIIIFEKKKFEIVCHMMGYNDSSG